jgi:Fur family ferric uptake transcriptional regulator
VKISAGSLSGAILESGVQNYPADFRDYLSNKGYKVTQQRMGITHAFFDFDGHPTAEELLNAVRKRDPSVSQATVYRTLKLLSEAGLAKEMHFGDGMARFERYRDEKEHHDHLICERCGQTIEFFSAEIERLQEKFAKRHQFTPTRHRLYLYGICPICRKTEEGA